LLDENFSFIEFTPVKYFYAQRCGAHDTMRSFRRGLSGRIEP
jgi:hypothetical protein